MSIIFSWWKSCSVSLAPPAELESTTEAMSNQYPAEMKYSIQVYD